MGVIWTILTIAVGLAAYWFRCWRQFYYGVVEIVVALVVIIFTFYPQTYIVLTTDYVPPLWGSTLRKIIGASAGIYIMVRGLDNMDRGPWPNWLPPKFRHRWDQVFHGKAVV
jgi:hypothetical protein